MGKSISKLNIGTLINGDKKGGVAVAANQFPKPVILDTDWWTDVDDASALRCSRYLEEAGLFDIVACVLSAESWYSSPSLSGLFNYDGGSDMVIGISGNGESTGTPAWQEHMTRLQDREYSTTSECEDAVDVYRRALSTSEDKITIVVFGYLSNVSALLKSTADSISTKTGLELVTEKVDRIYVMGGQYPSGLENNFTRTAEAIEGAYYVCNNCPVPITFLDGGVGSSVLTGIPLNTDLVTTGSFVSGIDYVITDVGDTDFTLIGADDNVVGTEFEATGVGDGTTGKAILATSYDPLQQAYYDHGSYLTGNGSWDLMVVMLASMYNPYQYGMYTIKGSFTINETTGESTWVENTDGKDEIVRKNTNDEYWSSFLNSIIQKNNWATDRTDIGNKRLEKLSRTTYYDDNNLKVNWDFNRFTNIPDGTSIYLNNDLSLEENDLGLRSFEEPSEAPTKQTKASLPCIKIEDGQKLISKNTYDTGLDFCIYLKVLWDDLPTSRENFFSQDSGVKKFHIKMEDSTEFQAIAFNPTTVASANITLTTDTWLLFCIQYTSDGVTAYFNDMESAIATNTGATTYTQDTPLVVGSRYSNSTVSEQSYVNYNAIRVYEGIHDQDDRTAVKSEMGL